MSSHLDYWPGVVNNGNFGDDGSYLTRHNLRKWVRDFVKRMAIHNTFVK